MDNIKWPGWETVKLIGRGSFGAVYEIQRQVFADTEKAALKVISIPQNESDIDEMYSDGYDDESITTTFQSYLQSIVAEYSLMRKMNGSAHIVNCDDVQYNPHRDGVGWDVLIKMELLTPLTKALPDVIPEETVVKIATDMCAALELCRKYGIVHRDIKPQNIFVSKHGDYKLGDFGIAKTVEKTMGGTKIGTYKYMAPEVYHNQPYGAAADIYSLGLVLYCLLNERRLPFMPLPPEKLKAGMEEEARDRRFAGEPIPAPKNGSAELKRIVLKACAFHPSNRYASASEMLADLKQLGQDSLGQASIVLSSAAATESPEHDNTVGVFGTASAIHTVIPDSLEKEAARRKAEEAVHRKAEEARRKAEEEARRKEEEARRKEEEARREADQRKKKLWAILGVAAAVIAVILALSLRKTPPPPTPADDSNEAVCAHIWCPADCVTPQTCSKCGITNGSPADHRWTAATCTAPRTCTACGLADGMPADHQWMAATCTAPKTCHVCGFTAGTPAGHQWKEATQSKPRTCSVCGQTDGTPLANPLVNVIREHLPLTMYAMGLTQYIYGYEDEELTQKNDAYYFNTFKDQLVIVDVSQDGTALKIRYPSSVTESGYRTLWFPFADIISIDKVEIGTARTAAQVATYRFVSADGKRSQCGLMDTGSSYRTLGTDAWGYTAIIYEIYGTVIHDVVVEHKLALMAG